MHTGRSRLLKSKRPHPSFHEMIRSRRSDGHSHLVLWVSSEHAYRLQIHWPYPRRSAIELTDIETII